MALSDNWKSLAEERTRSGFSLRGSPDEPAVPGLTILWHPDPMRVGHQVALTNLEPGRPASLSRNAPLFHSPKGGSGRALEDPHLSRRPWSISMEEGGVSLDSNGSSTSLTINGQASDSFFVSKQKLEEQVVCLLADRIVLLFHFLPLPCEYPDCGMVGQSGGINRVRRDILKARELTCPVLIKGETGTGKELVANAVAKGGPWENRPFSSINMGAIPPSVAAAELFGCKKGAFSGAESDRKGHFLKADGGTLFLDEIGETSKEVQPMLLRVLESGEIQPLGSDGIHTVSVRVIAASDKDLEAAATRGEFRSQLLHRLAGFEVALPPLRHRKDDIGTLLCHFVEQELAACGAPRLFDPGPLGRPWMSAESVVRLAEYPWPGNVRELRNVARALVVGSLESGFPDCSKELDRLLGPVVHEPSQDNEAVGEQTETKQEYKEPWSVNDDDLCCALTSNNWNIRKAAQALGVSRASLYSLIERHPTLRTASDLRKEEIESSMERCKGSLDKMMEELEVSKRGLQIRMKELGIKYQI